MAFNIGDQIDYNINNQKDFFNKKKQHKSIWDDHSLLRIFVAIIIPTTIITFMSALYIFIDELLLTRLVPLSNTFENMITGAGTSYNDYIDYVDKLNNAGLDVYLTKYSTTLIVRNAITYFAPLALIIVAFSQFVFAGSSLYFAKVNGKTINNNAGQAWCTSFYFVLIIYVIFAGIFSVALNSILHFEHGDPYAELMKGQDLIFQACNKTGLDFNTVFLCLQKVYSKASDLTMLYSKEYGYIVIGGLILTLYSSLLSGLLIAEGRSVNIIIAIVVSNTINIFLDWILIYYAHMAVIGSAVATLIGYVINNLWFFIYIKVLNKRNMTNLHYSDLNLKKHNFKLHALKRIFFFGLSSLVRNLCDTFMNFLLLFIFSSILIKIIGDGGTTADGYTNFYGAILPIEALFVSLVSGMVHGARIMIAHYYGLKDFGRLRKSFAISQFFVALLSIWFALVIVFNKYFLMIFNIHESTIASTLLILVIIKDIVYIFSMGPNILFQAIGQTVRSNIAAMTYNLICFVPVSFIMFGISIVTKQEIIYLASPLASIVVSWFVWNIWISTFYNKYLTLTSYDNKVIWMKNKGYFKPKTK